MPALDAPVPVLGQYFTISDVVTVRFNHPLVVVPALDTANWFVRVNNQDRVILTASVIPGTPVTVLLSLGGITADIGADVASFSPPPFDVISDVGFVPAPAFADLPLVQIIGFAPPP